MQGISLTAQLEGMLFHTGKPISKSDIMTIFGLQEEELTSAVTKLQNELANRGIVIIDNEHALELATHPLLDPLIDSLRKDDVARDIGKAGAETLAIILYRAPATRTEIEQIRGVNCQHIIRNLLIRDLIEKDQKSKTPRYVGSTALLRHLGIQKREDLPNFSATMERLEAFEDSMKE
jgi:segregation and condensation protein B